MGFEELVHINRLLHSRPRYVLFGPATRSVAAVWAFEWRLCVAIIRDQYSTSVHLRSRELLRTASQMAISLWPSTKVEKSPPGRTPAMKP